MALPIFLLFLLAQRWLRTETFDDRPAWMSGTDLRHAPNLFDHPLAVPDWEVVEARRSGSSAVPSGPPDPMAALTRGRPYARRAGRGCPASVGWASGAGSAITSAPAPTSSTRRAWSGLLAHRDGSLAEVGVWRVICADPDETCWFDVLLSPETVMAVIDEAHIDRERPS
ncbi:MAG: hypothetical protein R3C32_06620 [Chloroflexota bacterium]